MKEMYKVIADFPVTKNLLDIFENKQVCRIGVQGGVEIVTPDSGKIQKVWANCRIIALQNFPVEDFVLVA